MQMDLRTERQTQETLLNKTDRTCVTFFLLLLHSPAEKQQQPLCEEQDGGKERGRVEPASAVGLSTSRCRKFCTHFVASRLLFLVLSFSESIQQPGQLFEAHRFESPVRSESLENHKTHATYSYCFPLNTARVTGKTYKVIMLLSLIQRIVLFNINCLTNLALSCY